MVRTSLLVLLLVIAGCGTGEAPAISNLTLAELPPGLGRGYPVADLTGMAESAGDSEPGAPAPNFWLRTDDNRRLNLHDLQGQPVLINFWATWCGPCRLEMPEIVKTAATEPDLLVLAVNVQEELAQIQPFAEEFQMTMPIVRDSNGDLRRLYAVRGMPTSIFIDKEGKIVAVWAGVLTADLLQEFLATLRQDSKPVGQ